MNVAHRPSNDAETAALQFAESYFAFLGLPEDAPASAVASAVEEYRRYIAANWRTPSLRSLSGTYNDVYLKKIKATFADPSLERAYRARNVATDRQLDCKRFPLSRIGLAVLVPVFWLFSFMVTGNTICATEFNDDTPIRQDILNVIIALFVSNALTLCWHVTVRFLGRFTMAERKIKLRVLLTGLAPTAFFVFLSQQERISIGNIWLFTGPIVSIVLVAIMGSASELFDVVTHASPAERFPSLLSAIRTKFRLAGA